LIAELFVFALSPSQRERLNELKAAEEAGGGRAYIEAILRALVGPTCAAPRPRTRALDGRRVSLIRPRSSRCRPILPIYK